MKRRLMSKFHRRIAQLLVCPFPHFWSVGVHPKAIKGKKPSDLYVGRSVAMSNSTEALTNCASAISLSPAWCVVAKVSRAIAASRCSKAAASASPSVGSVPAREGTWPSGLQLHEDI